VAQYFWLNVYSYQTWKNNAASLRKTIEGRNDVFKRNMQNYFGLSDAEMAKLFNEDSY
jgi:hypothetical protein